MAALKSFAINNIKVYQAHCNYPQSALHAQNSLFCFRVREGLKAYIEEAIIG